MSILSDAEIAELCVTPTHVLDTKKYFGLLGMARILPTDHFSDPKEKDEKIRQECMRETTEEERAAFVPMIHPFSPELIRSLDERKIISRGLSSFGYDITLSDHVEIFSNVNSTIINPKKFDRSCLTKAQIRTDEDGSRYIVLPPNSYMLGYSVEYFRFPRDITAVFIGKSTYARAGLFVNCTPAEAGWEGQLVIEVGNSTSLPVMVFVEEGIAQALFFKGNRPCNTSYHDRGGKYQGQRGLTTAKV